VQSDRRLHSWHYRPLPPSLPPSLPPYPFEEELANLGELRVHHGHEPEREVGREGGREGG